jgi:uncharacterized delta-60 repeat protein
VHTDHEIHVMTLQPDGRALIAGEFDGVSATDGSHNATRHGLARLLTNGVVDLTFEAPAILGDEVHCLAVQPDGKILVGGEYAMFNHQPLPVIARLNPDGSLDPTFNAGTNLYGLDPTVDAIAVQADGRILVGGSFELANGVSGRNLARLQPDGSLDCSFNAGDTFFNDEMGGDDPVSFILIQDPTRAIVSTRLGPIQRIFLGSTGGRPVVAQQPVAQRAAIGQSATFNFVACGQPPLAYQWRKDGVLLVNDGRIVGADTARLFIGLVLAADAGDYSVVVTNASGAATSVPARLTLLAAPWVNVVNYSPTPGATLLIQGPPGSRVQLEFTASLSAANTWSALATGTLSATGWWEFVDRSAGAERQRFYRPREWNPP